MSPRLAVIIFHLIILAGLAAGVAAGISGCGREPATGERPGKPVLAVTVFPVADLARRVTGDRWDVVALLPPGQTPHGYSLRPSVAASLRSAKVLIAVGPGLDDWALRAAKGAFEQREVVVLTEVLGLGTGPAANGAAPEEEERDRVSPDRTPTEDRDGHDHHSHGDDPHIWLDPVLTQKIVEQIATVLSKQDPAGRAVYEQNLAAVKKDLAALDEEYRTAAAGWRLRTLIVFHPGYGYLARRYGLEQVALMGAGGVTPARVEQIVQLIQQQHIRAVYREPQYESRWVETLSQRTGAKVLVLDPLGHANRAGYNSYFAMMRSNLAALQEGLDHGS